MNERTKQFRVGVVAIATVVITAILITWHSDFSSLPFADTYPVQILVNQAPGVAPNTPVRRRGILIGRVADVVATDDGALITVNVESGKEVKTNEAPRIQASLIGDSVIEFVPVGSAEDARPVTAEDPPVRGMYNPTPLDVLAEIQGDLRQTIISLGDAGREVATLAEQLNTVLGGRDVDRFNRLITNAEQTLAGMSTTVNAINDLIGDEQFRTDIKNGVAQIPSTVSDARAVFEAMERLIVSANENLENLRGLTGPLGDRGDSIVGNIEAAIRNLEVLFNEVALLSANINDSEGTLGLLIKDRELYDRVLDTISQANGTIAAVNGLVDDPTIHARIRQILDNVNTITQKIKMDPARVLRGVANRETPLTDRY